MKTKRLLPMAALAFLLAAGNDRAGAATDPLRNPKKKAPEIKVEPNPGTLQGYRNQIGKSFYFEVAGAVGGTIWGTGIYTDDSLLATACVHAGVLRNGQTGVVKVTMLPGQNAYQGSAQNGVQSQPYQQWTASYRIEPVDPRLLKVREQPVQGKVLPDPGTLSNYQGKVGQSFLFEVTGTTNGAVWGSGIYTDDSTLAAAAVHAGILRNGQKGVVKVTMLAGQAAYQGSVQNGVTSANWNNWNSSYRIEAPPKK
jgi:hypothetical protein